MNHTMSDDRYYERKRQITDLYCRVAYDGLPPVMRTVLVEFVRDGGWTWAMAYVDELGHWNDSHNEISITEPVELWWPLPFMPKDAQP